MKNVLKTIFRIYLQGFIYIAAGISHFLFPEMYIEMMPNYFPAQSVLNPLAGIAEILLGIGLMIPMTRKFSSTLLIGLLVVFIPVHVEMIKTGWRLSDGSEASLTMLWLRLLLIHPLLIVWAYYAGRESSES
jgi:uncharacterized membrane protein